MNPLFPDDADSGQQPHGQPAQGGYVLPHTPGSAVQPAGEHKPEGGAEAAIELIRRKVNALYEDEPSAAEEIAETQQAATTPRSKHQQFMHELSTSGKSLAEIQTAWHSYYQGLNDIEKREVWQEFYTANQQQPSAYTKYVQKTKHPQVRPAHAKLPVYGHPVELPQLPEEPESDLTEQGKTHGTVVVANHLPQLQPDQRSLAAVKKDIIRKVRNRRSNNSYIKAKQHFQSLAFGIGLGSLVLLVALFGLFNEMIIAPFIHPGATASATPIILSVDGVAPSDKDEVIIPKLNLELPTIFPASANENDIENNLDTGVVHYPTTAMPGQQGNTAFFGHSSNNIFNKGNYKFAFVRLHELEPGDVFYLTHSGKLYTYKVYDKKTVKPDQTWVLNNVDGKNATATLITCDPPGTSINRLVVWGEQISPDPNANAAAATVPVTKPKTLPSQSPSLWSRMWSWL